MNKRTRGWIFAAILLIIIGFFIFAGGFAMAKWNFNNLSTVTLESNHHQISEPIKNISITVDTADVVFTLSDSQNFEVDCYEEKNEKHRVTVENETLTIKAHNEKKWYEYLGIRLNSPKITLSLPKNQWGNLTIKIATGDITLPQDLKFENIDITGSTATIQNNASALNTIKVKNSTGDLFMENISAKSLDLSLTTGHINLNNIQCQENIKAMVSTGKTKCTDVQCKSMESKGSTGDLHFKNVLANETLSIERSTGDIRLEDCDAGELHIKTDTGDVSGKLLTEKVFITHTDTGRIEVPKTINGGRCEITTDTGNIKFQ